MAGRAGRRPAGRAWVEPVVALAGLVAVAALAWGALLLTVELTHARDRVVVRGGLWHCSFAGGSVGQDLRVGMGIAPGVGVERHAVVSGDDGAAVLAARLVRADGVVLGTASWVLEGPDVGPVQAGARDGLARAHSTRHAPQPAPGAAAERAARRCVAARLPAGRGGALPWPVVTAARLTPASAGRLGS